MNRVMPPTVYQSEVDALMPERRAMLAAKARRLYGKFCGTGGRGICVESFAVYHIGRGEAVVAEDLVEYLDRVIAELKQDDPSGRLAATQGLAARIRRHLSEAIGSEGMPVQSQPMTGEALRHFVVCSSSGSATCER